MSESAPASTSQRVLNVPNQLTLLRIALSVVLFVVLPLGWYKTSLALFAITAGTDWIDGYWARKYGQITKLGRVLDPFADKLLICGTYVFLAAVPRLGDGTSPSGVAAWVAVVVLGRELLVTTLRALVEQGGGDFSAKWIGKWKMLLQCLAAAWSMVQLSFVDQSAAAWRETPPPWMSQGLTVVVWMMVLLTVYSGAIYVRAALSLLRPSR